MGSSPCQIRPFPSVKYPEVSTASPIPGVESVLSKFSWTQSSPTKRLAPVVETEAQTKLPFMSLREVDEAVVLSPGGAKEIRRLPFSLLIGHENGDFCSVGNCSY